MSEMPFDEGTTLGRFLVETLREHPGATGTFVNLCQSIALAGKMISSRVNRAGLAGLVGETGEVNIQGEFVQKLDVYANDTFKRALEHGGHTAMVVSEEDPEPTLIPKQWHSGRYVVAVDPLDGSSNIDVNATIGTIFAIFRRKSEEGEAATMADALRSGSEVLAAGYLIYGSGTILVLGSEAGVHGFTLDPTVGEFFLSHPNIRIPDGNIYSCNEAYSLKWQKGVQTFLHDAKKKEMKARYIGSLVADFHRNLLKGGVFLYPASEKDPKGKLRLLYEAFPLAYLVEQAGGAATDGKKRILDLIPTELHERTPLIIGSKKLVQEVTDQIAREPGYLES